MLNIINTISMYVSYAGLFVCFFCLFIIFLLKFLEGQGVYEKKSSILGIWVVISSFVAGFFGCIWVFTSNAAFFKSGWVELIYVIWLIAVLSIIVGFCFAFMSIILAALIDKGHKRHKIAQDQQVST